MSIGQKLSDLRKSKHLSQEEVADILGVTRQTISKWETDQSNPDLDKIVPLCELYGLSADELLGNSNSKEGREDRGDFLSNELNEELEISRKKKKALGIGLSVLGYFIAVSWIMVSIPVMNINPVVGTAVFLLICGIATFIVIYSCMVYSSKSKKEEEYDSKKALAKKINEVIALIFLIIYFLVSFTTFAWHITWILWIVYALVEQIVNLLVELKGDKNEK